MYIQHRVTYACERMLFLFILIRLRSFETRSYLHLTSDAYSFYLICEWQKRRWRWECWVVGKRHRVFRLIAMMAQAKATAMILMMMMTTATNRQAHVTVKFFRVKRFNSNRTENKWLQNKLSEILFCSCVVPVPYEIPLGRDVRVRVLPRWRVEHWRVCPSPRVFSACQRNKNAKNVCARLWYDRERKNWSSSQ